MTTLKVFIPDNKYVWLACEIKEINNDVDETTVNIIDKFYKESNRIKTVNVKKLLISSQLQSLPLYNDDFPIDGVNDLCTLGYLHEASILDNLNRRFNNKLPYTYAGNICIAVNPYQWLNIYTKELQLKYSTYYRNELNPHVYATSSDAYRGLSNHNKNQSILISGESGAGKTETVKILMNHIAYISNNKNDEIINKILQSNPLLESFGNAKTIRNDNSSRFGKFTELLFNNNNILIGSKCITYLLEKTRIISINQNERNYHIFYQLLSAPNDIKNKLHLSNLSINCFNYLSNGDTTTSSIENISDDDRFILTIQSLKDLNISNFIIDQLLQVLTAILFIGQIKFIELNDEIDIEMSNDFLLTCQYLNIDINILKKCLLIRTIEIKSNVTEIYLSINQAVNNRDTLVKEIYSRIFQWLVYVINYNTFVNISLYQINYKSISLLDIFGFESFASNYYEQLLINYTNEKLQQLFISNVLFNIQNEYIDEGLSWDTIDISTVDNKIVIELIDNRSNSLFTLLNEECLLPKGTDSSLLNKLSNQLANKYPNYIYKDRLKQDSFTIVHYAGVVSYTINGFIERNKDNISNDLTQVMLQSNNCLLSNLFNKSGYQLYGNNPNISIDSNNLNNNLIKSLLLVNITNDSDIIIKNDNNPADINSPTRSNYITSESVSTKFKGQLNKLIDKISSSQVQYVRCIKPNESKSNTEYDRPMVVQQLRSAGMIEAIAISRAAFPNHLTHKDFIRRFNILYPKFQDLIDDAIVICSNLLLHLINQLQDNNFMNDKCYAIGKSKIYFGKNLLESIERMRVKYVAILIIRIQSNYRSYYYGKLYKLKKQSTIMLQSHIRRFKYQSKFKFIRRKIIFIQLYYIRYRLKVIISLKRRVNATIIIQSNYRMIKCKRIYNKNVRAIKLIQSYFLMYKQRKKYLVIRDKYRDDCDIRNQLKILQNELTNQKIINDDLMNAHESVQKQLLHEKESKSLITSKLSNEVSSLYLIIQQLKEEINDLKFRLRNMQSDQFSEIDSTSKQSPNESSLNSSFDDLNNDFNLIKLQSSVMTAIESKQGYPAIIYLYVPKENQLVSKAITIHKTLDKSNQCRIEFAFENIQYKRLRFLISELIDIHIDNKLDINISDVDRNHAITLVIHNKGYLNISLANQTVRNVVVNIFHDLKSKFVDKNDIPIDNKTIDSNNENKTVNNRSLDMNKYDSSSYNSPSISRSKQNISNSASISPISPSVSSTWRIVNSPTIIDTNSLNIIIKEYVYIENNKSINIFNNVKTKVFLSLDKASNLLLIGNNNSYLCGYPSQIKQVIALSNDMTCKPTTNYWFNISNHVMYQLEIIQNSNIIFRFQLEFEESMLLWEKYINEVIESIGK